MSDTQFYLSIQGRNIPLTYHTQLTQTDIPELQPQGYDGVVAQVNPNPKKPSILGLKNCSTQMWTVTLPIGEIRQIQTGQTIKLEENTHINFGEQQIENVDNFFKSDSTNQVILDVVLSETYKLYNNQGEVDTKERDYYRGIMRFHLIYSEDRWKIYDYENIKTL